VELQQNPSFGRAPDGASVEAGALPKRA